MRLITRNGEKIFIYEQGDRAAATSVSLTSLAASMGYTPTRIGGYYTLKEIDSIRIYNDSSWYRWSGKGGRQGGSQIDFLMEFGNAEGPAEAIYQLLKYKGEHLDEVVEAPAPEETSRKTYTADRELRLPPKNPDYKRTFAYLMKTRGISKETVEDFIHRKLIYESADHHNIVFLGKDPDGNIRYAGMRGTADIYGKKFKGDVPGNDKNYGVNIVYKDSGILLVFESVIDCMSYIDIYDDHFSNKLVLGMVEDNPLEQFLKDYPHIYNIKFCLDNDDAAHAALNGRSDTDGNIIKPGLIKKYEDMGYEVDVLVPPLGKDWNESLCDIRAAAELKADEEDVTDLVGRGR